MLHVVIRLGLIGFFGGTWGTPGPSVTVEPPSAREVASLYASVGRELKVLQDAKGLDATIELWPRYRWIRINEAMATPEKRAETATLLHDLVSEIRSR
ncbi:MAG TPA: hypothetical protein VLB44_17700 [Kofleriaceae bacterium]|nr:hypothetical protein [Kofleriaceae bacterium]